MPANADGRFDRRAPDRLQAREIEPSAWRTSLLIAATACAALADGAGLVAIVPKIWREPHSETASTYAAAGLSGLLAALAAQPGRVFTRTELLDDVWGQGHDGYDHTVNSHINRLRSKLGDEREQARFIHTVWGVGYRFEVALS